MNNISWDALVYAVKTYDITKHLHYTKFLLDFLPIRSYHKYIDPEASVKCPNCLCIHLETTNHLLCY